MLLAQLVLSLLTSLGCPVNNCIDTYSISGTVTDKENKAPIQGVNVFIAGSQLGSNTDPQGYFEINGIEIESFQLVFSHIGYELKMEDINVRALKGGVNVALKPAATKLETVVVSSVKDRKWDRNLKKFKKFFFGELHDENQITLENEYLIDFVDRRGKGLRVENKPGLDISNNYLGYDVHFEMIEFKLDKLKSYMGYSMFKEKEAASPEMRQQWLANRKRAYYGSQRHFFKSLLANALNENAFGVSLITDNKGFNYHNLSTTKRERVILMDDGTNKPNIRVRKLSKQTFELYFEGALEVTYFDEEDKYGDPQSSEIVLNEPLLIDKNGVLLNPNAVISYGFWSQEGLYELLPFEYNPNQN